MNAAHPVIGLRRVMLSPAFQHGWPGENLLPMTLSTPFSGRRISVLANATRLLCLSITAMVFLAGVSLPADAGEAAINCVTLAPWTNYPTPPQVHQLHVFCGEWKQNTPRGLHARPGGLNPVTVDRFTITQVANAQGIYGGSWIYTGHPHPPKFSTMFPDDCTMSQVLHSIVYAARHATRCPAHAPRWAVCGPNRPPSASPSAGLFCDSSNGRIFLIAMAKLSDGRVNTAFPLR
jgi:hypothetical protein